MSWNGTVRCGHCYEKGHNKRTCPQLAKRMEERIAANPDDWYAKNYYEKKKGSRKRTCTYCGEQGHNRRTCPKLKEATATWTRCNAAFREQVLAEIKAQGLGLGALIEIKECYMPGSGYVNNQLAVVTALRWDKVDVEQATHSPTREFVAARLVGKYSGKDVNLALPVRSENKLGWGTGHNPPSVAGSGEVPCPPEGWLAGEASKERLKEVFEKDKWGSHWVYRGDSGSEWVENTSGVATVAQGWVETLVEGEE